MLLFAKLATLCPKHFIHEKQTSVKACRLNRHGSQENTEVFQLDVQNIQNNKIHTLTVPEKKKERKKET